jgi:hypothetical protein
VIDVNDREHDAELFAHLKQKAQKRNRIRAAGNGNAEAIAGMKQLRIANVMAEFLRQFVHEHIVQPGPMWRGHSLRLRSGQALPAFLDLSSQTFKIKSFVDTNVCAKQGQVRLPKAKLPSSTLV